MTGFLYYYSGFEWIQDMVDRAFTELVANRELPLPAAYVRPFPVPKYRRDDFAWALGRMFALIMTLAWIYTVSMICKSVVYEKETRLKEYMKIMGLKSSVHWLAWFLTEAVIVSTSVILLTVILIGGQVGRNVCIRADSDAITVGHIVGRFPQCSASERHSLTSSLCPSMITVPGVSLHLFPTAGINAFEFCRAVPSRGSVWREHHRVLLPR